MLNLNCQALELCVSKVTLYAGQGPHEEFQRLKNSWLGHLRIALADFGPRSRKSHQRTGPARQKCRFINRLPHTLQKRM